MKIPLGNLLPFETIPPDKSLIESIVRFGQLVPILVTQIEDKYEVRDGKRRVEALRLLNRNEVDAVLYEVDNNILTLIGNMQRSNNPIAEGEAIYALLNQGMTKEEIRDVLGIPLYKIYSRVWLYSNLHPDLKQKIIDGKMDELWAEIRELRKPLAGRENC